jgi:hypothetical protein
LAFKLPEEWHNIFAIDTEGDTRLIHESVADQIIAFKLDFSWFSDILGSEKVEKTFDALVIDLAIHALTVYTKLCDVVL